MGIFDSVVKNEEMVKIIIDDAMVSIPKKDAEDMVKLIMSNGYKFSKVSGSKCIESETKTTDKVDEKYFRGHAKSDLKGVQYQIEGCKETGWYISRKPLYVDDRLIMLSASEKEVVKNHIAEVSLQHDGVINNAIPWTDKNGHNKKMTKVVFKTKKRATEVMAMLRSDFTKLQIDEVSAAANEKRYGRKWK